MRRPAKAKEIGKAAQFAPGAGEVAAGFGDELDVPEEEGELPEF
jgi:hypothetical protein